MKCHGALYIPLHNCTNALKRAAACATPCLMPGPTSHISIRPIRPIQASGRAAGLAGAVGLVSCYQALAVGRMGINAPVTAVLAAALPVIFSVFFQGLPGLLQVAGFTLALIAVWLISRPERARGRPEGVGLALLAGLGFGSFFILISRASSTAIFWPLAAPRLASCPFMLTLLLIRPQDL